MKHQEAFEILEIPKKVPHSYRLGEYLIDLVRLVQEGDIAIDEAKSEKKKLERVINDIMVQIADYLFEQQRINNRLRCESPNGTLDMVLKHLSSTDNRLNTLIGNHGFSFEDPVGRILNEDLLNEVEIHGWLPTDNQEETVHETILPIVRKDGKLIRLAKVIGISPNAFSKPSGGIDDHR